MFLALWQNSFSFGRLGTASPKFPSRFDLYQRARVATDAQESYGEKDQLQLRETRIIYKRKPRGRSRGPDQFAAVASLKPQLYVDPNDAIRQRAGAQTLAKADPVSKHVGDPSAEKVAIQTLK